MYAFFLPSMDAETPPRRRPFASPFGIFLEKEQPSPPLQMQSGLSFRISFEWSSPSEETVERRFLWHGEGAMPLFLFASNERFPLTYSFVIQPEQLFLFPRTPVAIRFLSLAHSKRNQLFLSTIPLV